MAAKWEHESKKLLEKKVTNVGEVPCAYTATVTNTIYQLFCECEDCGEKWTETKEESKLNESPDP